MNRVVPVFLFALSVAIGSFIVIFSPFEDEAEDAEAVLAENDIELGREVVEQPAQPASQQVVLDNRNPELEPLDHAAVVVQSRERALRRAELITAAVDSEAVDPQWAAATEQQIAERFAAEAPPGFELLSTTCKTSLCIAEVETPSREASRAQTGWHKFFGFSRTRVYHQGEEGDAFRTVVFLARDGHHFPK